MGLQKLNPSTLPNFPLRQPVSSYRQHTVICQREIDCFVVKARLARCENKSLSVLKRNEVLGGASSWT